MDVRLTPGQCSTSGDAVLTTGYADDFTTRGKSFLFEKNIAISNGGTAYVLFDYRTYTPAPGDSGLVFIFPPSFATTAGPVTVKLYRDTGYSGGTPVTVLNPNTLVAKRLAGTTVAVGATGSDKGTLAMEYLVGTSTTAGVVPTDATAGVPIINAFVGANKGYITRLNAYSSVSGQLQLADLLWKGGAYPFNAAVTLSAQPSYAGRVPGGTDFSGCELWLECVTQFTGNQSIRVQYTDGNDVAQDTGTIATGVAPIVGRMYRLPTVEAGIKRIDVVTSTVATVGTFNVIVLRPLAFVRIPFAGYSEQRDLYGTGMPEVFADSALAVYVRADSTATGLPELDIEISNG